MEDRPCIELNDQPLKIVENFHYLGNAIGARGGAFDSAITGIKRVDGISSEI